MKKAYSIGIGFNSAVGVLPAYFKIGNLGYYTAENLEETDEMIINDMDEDTGIVTASLPETADISNVKVLINGEPYSYASDGNTVSIDTANLERGAYELYVGAYFSGSPKICGATAELNIEYQRTSARRFEGEWLDFKKRGGAEIASWYEDSGDGMLMLWENHAQMPEGGYKFEYNIYAPESGDYMLGICGTRTDFPVYHSPYTVYVNGNAADIRYEKNISGELNLSSARVKLCQGKNSIVFEIKTPRTADNADLFYLDYFETTLIAGTADYAEGLAIGKNVLALGEKTTATVNNINGGKVRYESGNAKIAEIDENGTITARGSGRTKIRAHISDGTQEYTEETDIFVCGNGVFGAWKNTANELLPVSFSHSTEEAVIIHTSYGENGSLLKVNNFGKVTLYPFLINEIKDDIGAANEKFIILDSTENIKPLTYVEKVKQ